MTHPKMRYTYVGVDSHRDTHTAVFLDCFFEKLGEITFENLPSKFGEFLENALKLRQEGTELLFGLEDASMYGRTLAVFLSDNGIEVKHVNALLVARERKNRNIFEKTDSVDAECAARILLSKFGEIPGAVPQDKYWILKTLVTRRAFIVKNNASLKNHLHSLLIHHYPNYRALFPNIRIKAALAFFSRYPSPKTLEGTTVEELTDFFYAPSQGKVGEKKARLILDTIEDTAVPFQELRDEAVRSAIRQTEYNLQEIERLDSMISGFLPQFNCTLASMNGIKTVTAAQLLSCIGDIRKFPSPAKLARYSGIAPVTYASGQRDAQFVNRSGNRELNSILYLLARRFIGTSAGKAVNPFLYEYYCRKVSEGKTKKQALKCVQRRLVNIIWGMLTYNREYVNPAMIKVSEILDNTEE